MASGKERDVAHPGWFDMKFQPPLVIKGITMQDGVKRYPGHKEYHTGEPNCRD